MERYQKIFAIVAALACFGFLLRHSHSHRRNAASEPFFVERIDRSLLTADPKSVMSKEVDGGVFDWKFGGGDLLEDDGDIGLLGKLARRIKAKWATEEDEYRAPFLPPEPHISPGCRVWFKDPSMALCSSQGGSFGDELGPAAVRRILEYKSGCSAEDVAVIDPNEDARDGRRCLFSLGSVFHHVRDGDHVWGTGIDPRRQQGGFPDSLTVHSVSGPNTARMLQEGGVVADAGAVPHSDPGFLIPFLYSRYYHLSTRSERPPAYWRLDFCFVPHAQDLEYAPEIKNPPTGLRIVSTTQRWEPMLEELRMCDYIASSSLRGIVLGDALGIPTKWFQFPGVKTADTERSFMCQDYFRTIGRGVVGPDTVFSMDNFQDASSYMQPLTLEARNSLAEEFVSSFPFDLFEEPPHAQQDRTLVIVMGSLRGGEKTWETMYQNLLDVNNADLALVLGAEPDSNKTESMYQRASYVYEFQEYDDWTDAVDLIDGPGWRETLLRYSNPKFGTGAVIFMARFFVLKAFEEHGWGDKYDRFVLTRSDHYYSCAHDLSVLDRTKLWVPDGEDHKGITDRHLVAPRELFPRALDVIFTPVRHPSKYVDKFWQQSNYNNPEGLIKRRWVEEGLWGSVRRFHRVMFTCADAGDAAPRWGVTKSQLRIPEDVRLKYPAEYQFSKLYCETSLGGQPVRGRQVWGFV